MLWSLLLGLLAPLLHVLGLDAGLKMLKMHAPGVQIPWAVGYTSAGNAMVVVQSNHADLEVGWFVRKPNLQRTA